MQNTKNDIVEKLDSIKDDLKKRFDIDTIGLFGSYANGKHNETSDIDILYQLNAESRMTLKKLHDLECYFHNIFNTTNIDLVDEKYLNPVVKHFIQDTVIYV